MNPLPPGLAIVHGNRLEMLRDVVFDWLAAHPLEPLEEEVFLVQSNGAAEWLKMSLATTRGICAATRVELPGRFLWRVYRRQLGRERVAVDNPLDRDALAWRLMRLLPPVLQRAVFRPVATFLGDGNPERRLQLARRLAELYDHYQVYRADWLDAWEHGRATLPSLDGGDRPIPDDQRWQQALWRLILDDLGDDERRSTRPHVHRAFMAALEEGRPPAEPLPRRVVLFGASHVSMQGLEALTALSSRMQVMLAIPNPCRFHWADIIDGREALASNRHRRALKNDRDLARVPLDAMHLHGNPLLAAWGRQGRDFMQQLDFFEEAASRRRLVLPRDDYFDDGPGTCLIGHVQAAIRDLVPLDEGERAVVAATDRSIVFHVAHGVHREVEVVHDQLLAMLDAAKGSLRPRDIVVMVPDIEVFAPSIRAVFGQHEKTDARRIPFDIADLRTRGSNPLVVGLEWLLRLPDQRVRLQEIRDLLEIPAVAARLAIDPATMSTVFRWLADAGVRWGLHREQRASIGLGAAGEQNSWLFGLRRMLLGYATGASEGFAGIQPYDEIGGLEASALGALVELFERLDAWWRLAASDASPAAWAERARTFVDSMFEAADERERLTIAALQAALATWLSVCEAAAFDDRVPLSVLREGWLSGVDGLEANRRFLTGGVTFCTLTPLRAVPFEVVCLLGMNDGDFPRPNRRNDFDLMHGDGHARPGDRSRRDDDRYLMLEAVLSARRALYISWSGKNARDNTTQPPSVLVAQLRDYLRAGWVTETGGSVLADRTVEHPLQPFGRRYFEDGGPTTFAREWRRAHDEVSVSSAGDATRRTERGDALVEPVSLANLGRFLRNPVKEFFRGQLGVQVADEPESIDDDEAFDLGKLAQYHLRSRFVDDPRLLDGDVEAALAHRVAAISGSGSLPLFERGSRIVDDAVRIARPMIRRWNACRAAFPRSLPALPIRFATDGIAIDDWLDAVRSNGDRDARIVMTASELLAKKGKDPQPHKFIAAWVAMVAASACGHRVSTIVIGCDAMLTMAPLARDEATDRLRDLLAAWTQGRDRALPFAAKTAIASLPAGDHRRAAAAYDGGINAGRGEREDFALRRLYPDFAALAHDEGFDDHARGLFAPMVEWVASSVIDVHVAIDEAAA